jgi:RHS repeat-associated protein
MYFGGRLLAPVDRLGSVRYNQNGPIAYFPWGEERTSTPDGTDKFATYFRDSTNNGIGEDYASARYYNNNFGRFWSPDPSGAGVVDMQNPSSWNMYAYANDDPVNLNDPTGLDCASTPLFLNDVNEGTVGSIISAGSNISILATAMYTESGHSGGYEVDTDEEWAIGAVIMNRWQFVNKNWYL